MTDFQNYTAKIKKILSERPQYTDFMILPALWIHLFMLFKWYDLFFTNVASLSGHKLRMPGINAITLMQIWVCVNAVCTENVDAKMLTRRSLPWTLPLTLPSPSPLTLPLTAFIAFVAVNAAANVDASFDASVKLTKNVSFITHDNYSCRKNINGPRNHKIFTQ